MNNKCKTVLFLVLFFKYLKFTVFFINMCTNAISIAVYTIDN